MRLRLTIKRQDLPPVKILFAVPEEATNISKLLELVDALIPLQADKWGLEDYVVRLQGYECLHFQDVHSILKDGDELDVAPITTTETKARRVSGRIQISESGVHLVDGVAFGRSLLKRSQRPSVQIPSPKRRRTTAPEEAVTQHISETDTLIDDGNSTAVRRRSSSRVRFDASTNGLDQTQDGYSEDDDSDDEDFEMEDEESEEDEVDEEDEAVEEEGLIEEKQSPVADSQPTHKSNQRQSSNDADSLSSASSSSESSADSSEESSEESSVVSSSSDDDEDDEDDTVIHHPVDATPITAPAVPAPRGPAASDNGKSVAPGSGSKGTKSRNARRRERNRRAWQKALGQNSPAAPQASSTLENTPQHWSKKIDLSAVECVDEGVQLCAPPFPFKQYWDPQYQWDPEQQWEPEQQISQSKKKSKKRKRKDIQQYYDEEQVEYGGEGLPYDEEDYSADVVNDSQRSNAAPEFENDPPALPDDWTSLEKPVPADLKPGAVLITTMMEVSAATHWRPGISPPRTWTVQHYDEDNGEITARLAQRDWPEIRRDENGNRLYDRHEMPGNDDDAEYDPVQYFCLDDCHDARLFISADLAARKQSLKTAVVQETIIQEPISSSPSEEGIREHQHASLSSATSSAARNLDQAAQLRASMLLASAAGGEQPDALDSSLETAGDGPAEGAGTRKPCVVL